MMNSRTTPPAAAPVQRTEQEPVACRTLCELCIKRGYNFCANAAKTTPITTPPAAQRTWVGLTDEERRGIREWQTIQEGLGPIWAPMMLYLYMAIEQRLKEKNNG
jgi:hypothetical protein